MNRYFEEAREKLETEAGAAKYDRYASAMAKSVKKALIGFCEQDAHLAERVVHGSSFEECMKAVAAKVGTSISDLEAYRRAVRFYEPDADVAFQMEIIRKDAAFPEKQEPSNIINLEDFL